MAIATIILDWGKFKDSPGCIYGYHFIRKGEVVYVGVTKNPSGRAKNHEAAATIDRNPGCKNNGIRKAERLGYTIDMVVRARFIDVAKAYEWEQKQITKYGRSHEGGTLWNRTAGGEGGIDPSPSTRAKISANSKRMMRGDHPFKGGQLQRSMHKRKFEDGTHHLLDPERLKAFGNLNTQTLAEGRHVFQRPGFYTERTKKMASYYASQEYKEKAGKAQRAAAARRKIPRLSKAARVALSWKAQGIEIIQGVRFVDLGISGTTLKEYGLRTAGKGARGVGKSGFYVDDVLHVLKKRYLEFNKALQEE